MSSKTVHILMGINRMGDKYIVGVFQTHVDAVQYADDWKVPNWHIYDAPFF
jgi:hypothetical protein